MAHISVLGIDTAKESFEIYGSGEGGKPFTKTLNREKIKTFFANSQKCTIFMEACGGSHYWGRQLKELGHEVNLIAPHKVRPFRKTNKNDRNDARACVLAGTCPGMEFVVIKDTWQQDILVPRIDPRSVPESPPTKIGRAHV